MANQPILFLAESGEELRLDKRSYYKNLNNYFEKYSLSEDDIYVIDKKGKHIKVSEHWEGDNQYFLFHKKFSKDTQFTNLEFNLDLIYNQCCNNYIPSFISKLVVLDSKDSIPADQQDLKLLSERIQEILEMTKDQFRKFKIQIKLGEKLKENLNKQSKALSVMQNNMYELLE